MAEPTFPMIAIAYYSLLLGLITSLLSAALAAWHVWRDDLPAQGTAADDASVACYEWAHLAITALLTVASAVLLAAFVNRDFSVKYVAEYSDSVLPLFYAITAFWAGQEGSLLLWAFSVALMAVYFQGSSGYRALAPRTRLVYWLFFLGIQSFFFLGLTNWSNPFIELTPAPPDGRGLNPLLQNVGMIFHPPLLFLGYGGYTVPFCVALACRVTGDERSWLSVGRNWLLVAWVFLTSGILLGAWWSYMELGWGGYWAWDPVENASLIPWLSGTALLHTALVEDRRGALHRTNVALLALTFLLCFFATYLVRSGVVQSLHAFGGGGIAGPLLTFICGGALLSVLVIVLGQQVNSRPLAGLFSRPGFLVLTAWLLLALAALVLMGTMWPVFSQLWTTKSVGLDANFYNRTCLPLFVGVAGLLLLCPWLNWVEGLRSGLWAVGVVFALLAAAGMYSLGMTQPLAMAGAALAAGALVGVVVLLATDKAARGTRPSLAAWGVHLGLALTILGVAISGPYQREAEAMLPRDGMIQLQGYTIANKGTREEHAEALSLVEARLEVTKDGQLVGVLTPQRRLYKNFEQPFSEVSVIPSLGNELYATLFGVSSDGAVSIKVSVHPLVNWVWIGGTIMCLAGLGALRLKRGGASSGERA